MMPGFTPPTHTPYQWHDGTTPALDAEDLMAAEDDLVAFTRQVAQVYDAYAETQFVHQDGTGLPSGVEELAHKDQASGYPSLDSSGRIPLAEHALAVVTGSSHGVYSAITHGGILPNDMSAGWAAKINTWLASLPNGSTAVFPSVAGSSQGITKYWIDQTVIEPPGVKIEMAPVPYGSPTVPNAESSLFACLGGTSGGSWTGPQVAVANGAMTSNVQAANGCTNYQPRMSNVGADLQGISNFTAFALIHPNELTDIDGLICYPNLSGTGGTGLIGLLVINNGDSPKNGVGFTRLRNIHAYAASSRYSNQIVCDATNNGTIAAGSWLPIQGFIIEYTAGSEGSSCTDSPVKLIGCHQVKLTGYSNGSPPNGTPDTACFRLIDCGEVVVEDHSYVLGSDVRYRPYIRATKTGGALPPGMPVVPPRIVNSMFYFTGAGGWSSRTDASCGLTAASTTITDASIVAADRYRPVYGPGIPSGAYVDTVTPGVSFTVQDAAHAPFITATVSLTISANVIEDETGPTPRHFQWHATYFDPKVIYDYSGPRCDWLQGPASAPVRRSQEAWSSRNENYWTSPSGAVSETFSRVLAPAASTLTINNAGTLQMVEKVLYPGDTVANIIWLSLATPLATGTHQWAALFGPALSQLAVSADLTSTAWAANTRQTFPMTTAYAVSLPAPHYLGLSVSATTAPTLASFAGPIPTIAGASGQIPSGTSTTGLSTPATCPATAASVAVGSNIPYAYIT